MRTILTLSLLLICSTCIAQDRSAVLSACENAVAAASSAEKSRFFPDVQRKAQMVNESFCEQLNNFPEAAPDIVSDYDGFLEHLNNAVGTPADTLGDFGDFLVSSVPASNFGSAGMNEDVRSAMQTMSNALGTQRSTRMRMPDFDVQEIDDDFDERFFYSVSTLDDVKYVPDVEEIEACRARFAGIVPDPAELTCLEVFEDLEEAINVYKLSYQAMTAQGAAQVFGEISGSWSRYFEVARSQTTFDLFLTSILERSHMQKGYIVGPPKRQWFLLRPNAILQFHDGAPKGDQFKPGLSVEWFGFNYWDESPLGFPFGLSIATTYADSPDVNTVGTGVTLHVKNSFTIGWARNGDDNSFHVSMDLLQLFEDKQEQFDKYKARFEALKSDVR